MAKTTTACSTHEKYYTRADADRALATLVENAKRTGQGGKSHRRLNVYECKAGHVKHWHVGRKNQPHVPPNSATPNERLITFGEARRKLAKLDRELERTVDFCLRKRIAIATRLVELDRVAGWLD
jgi:hypothetical protein